MLRTFDIKSIAACPMKALRFLLCICVLAASWYITCDYIFDLSPFKHMSMSNFGYCLYTCVILIFGMHFTYSLGLYVGEQVQINKQESQNIESSKKSE
jgi:hypothetical protein